MTNSTIELKTKFQELSREHPYSDQTALSAHAYLTATKLGSCLDGKYGNVSYHHESGSLEIWGRTENGSELVKTYSSDHLRELAKPFDLSSVMAATAKPIDDGRTVPGGPTGTTSAAPAVATVPTAQTAPTFRKGPDFAAAPKPQVVQADASTDARSSLPFPQRRGPDFTTAPAPKKKPEDEKLTSQTVIIQLNDFDIKPKLATDEIAKRGAGVAVARKAYRVDGTEIKASYEFTKAGKVLHTGYDGKQTEMTFEQAKRHEIAEINLLNQNAIIAINKMSTDPTFTLRQGDATFSVKGNFFVRTKDDGTVTKEPLAETQKRFTERGREIRAMGGPELDPKPPSNAMQAVQPKPEKTQRFARMADRADAAAAHENKSGKTLESGNQLGA